MNKISIIGGGVIGLASAWHLAQNGWHVTVFEAHTCGAGASSAALGSLVPYPPHRAHEPLPKIQHATLKAYPEFIKKLEESSGIKTHYRTIPRLQLLEIPAHHKVANKSVANNPNLYKILDDAHTECPLLQKGQTAMLCQDTAIVHTPSVIQALKTACERAGVVIKEHTPINKLPSGKTLVCTGAWANQLLPQAQPITPILGQVIRLKLKESNLNHMLRCGSFYLQPEYDGAILLGATKEKRGLATLPSQESYEKLLQNGIKYVPEIKNAKILATWVGLRPKTDTGKPFIGKIDNNVYAAIGFGGLGWCLAPWVGQEVEKILNT